MEYHKMPNLFKIQESKRVNGLAMHDIGAAASFCGCFEPKREFRTLGEETEFKISNFKFVIYGKRFKAISMPLNEIEDYFRNYDKKSYEVFSQQGAEPSMANVRAFESRIGFHFPSEFREFAVHPLGGLYMAVRKELWPRPQKYEVGPFWSFLYGLMIYSFSSRAPGWLQMNDAWRKMSEAGCPQLVPFLKIIGDPDPYCLTPHQGIVIWRHDNPGEPEEVAKNFSQVLLLEIHALEERKERRITGAPPPICS